MPFGITLPNRATIKDNKIVLQINSKDLIATKRVCSLVNCRYHIMTGLYDLPLTYLNTQTLKEWNFQFGRSLRDWERQTRQDLENSRVKLKNIEGFNATLMPFQARGVEFIDEVEGRALIADDPGLGKTIQALAWTMLHTEVRPVLIISPASVKINWQREIHLRTGCTNVQILEGRTPCRITGEYAIINYDVLDWWVVEIKRSEFAVLIADEAHYIRNSSSKRTKAFKRICKGIDQIIALTGTPIENYPIEIFNIVSVLNPRIFPNYYDFTKRFCDAKHGVFGWDVRGVSNSEELHRILTKNVMLRRKKSEVLTDLPPKQIAVVPLQISNRAEYIKAEKAFMEFLETKFDTDLRKEGIEKKLKQYAKLHDIPISEDLDTIDVETIKEAKLEKAKNAPVLVQMSALKQLAVKGKMEAVKEWITDFLESEEKLVVFAVNKLVIDELMQAFPKAVKIDGSVAKQARQKAIDSFQTDVNCRLIILNIDAGGIGITLTAASNVAMVQYPWTPGRFIQAADRVHRITQTKTVTIWNFVAANTIEEKILKVLSEKERIITDVMDGGKYDSSSMANEIIKLYKR